MLKRGDLGEILIVTRRRIINLLRFVRRMLLKVWRLIYDFPLFLEWRQKLMLGKIMNRVFGYSEEPTDPDVLQVGLVVRHSLTHPSSSAFIRLIAPLTTEPLKNKLHVNLLPENTVEVDPSIKVFIVQRTAYDDLNTAQLFVENLNKAKAMLVLDSDDAFSVINKSHPEHNEHSERDEALQFLVSKANQTWLSTNRLKESVSQTTEALVINNGLDKRLWSGTKLRRPKINDKLLRLVYMGTGTHDQDLSMIMPELDKLAEKYPDCFVLTIVGVASVLPERPWLQRWHVRRGLTIYPKFVRSFLKKGPFDIGLSPLVDNDFNRAKSDIKCLDYLAAGILPMVSDTEAYKNPELDTFVIKPTKESDGWYKALEKVISDLPAFRTNALQTIQSGQKYVWEKRSSETAGQLMYDQLIRFLNRNS